MYCRYDEHLAHVAAESETAESSVVEYRIPARLLVTTEPQGAVEDEIFELQPKINVLDAFVSEEMPSVHRSLTLGVLPANWSNGSLSKSAIY